MVDLPQDLDLTPPPLEDLPVMHLTTLMLAAGICLLVSANLQAHDSGGGIEEHTHRIPGDTIDGCFPTNQPLNTVATDAATDGDPVYYTSQCKLGCEGIYDSDGHVSTSYSRTYSCKDFDLPDAINGSPCLGGHEYIQANFPFHIDGLEPANYEETETTSGCASGTEGICRRVQLGNLVDGDGDRVNAPAGYFDSEKAVVKGMDFFITGTPVAGSGVQQTTSVPNAKAIRIISVSAAEGAEVERGDELYRYCAQSLQGLYDGLSQGSNPPTPLAISSSCTGIAVTASIKGTVTLAPKVNRIYADSASSLDDRCIVVAQGTGGTTKRCKYLSDLEALEDYRVDNYPTTGSGLGDRFETLCGTEGCIYEDGVISQVGFNEYDFFSNAHEAQIAFDRYFSSTTNGVQLHPAARAASGLILRAKCLHSTCRVDTSKSKPGLGDPATDSNPSVSRSFSITGWNTSSKVHTLGPLEGLADWLNKVDVTTLTIDLSFNTSNTTAPMNNACPYSPDPDSANPPPHPKDHPLYCAPEDSHDWSITYNLVIDPITKPTSTDLADNNCCTGYKQYACELSEEPRPTAEEWKGFASSTAVKDWFEKPVNKQQMQLTYVDHTDTSIGGFSTCPAGTNDSGNLNPPCWWHYDAPQGDWIDGTTASSWRSIRQYNSQSDCEQAVNPIKGGWQNSTYSTSNSVYGGGTGEDCTLFVYSGSPEKYTEFIFYPSTNSNLSNRPALPPKFAKVGSNRYPSKACPVHGTDEGQHDYTDDADCDGLMSDPDDATPSSFSTRTFRTRLAPRSFTRTDLCRYAPSTSDDGCPPGIAYKEVGQEVLPVAPVAPVAPIVPVSNTGSCAYEPVSMEGQVDVHLTVNEGDWDLCAWSGNWRDILNLGYDNPQTDCDSVPDFTLWEKSSDGGNGEDESFSLQSGLDDISICVVPYNATARQCAGNCYSGPTYTSAATVAIGDDEEDEVDDPSPMTWRTSGGEGWYYELNELPDWARKIVAVRKPNDARLKIFLADGQDLPDPITIGGSVVVGTGLREDSARRLWQIDVNPSMLDALGVPGGD